MINCPYCRLFRYDLSGCICSEQEYHSVWDRGILNDTTSDSTIPYTNPSNKIKMHTHL